MYLPHPSPELNELFAHKPYQGALPEQAKFLFVGLDANYAPQIAYKPIFSKIREYHHDGVEFWRKYKVHHPFLLPEYSGDGQFYHRSFANIGFKPEHAHLVSFIELLHVPTVGQSKLLATDLNQEHLRRLNAVILDREPQHIFLPAGVARLMRESGAFPWLPNSAKEQLGSLGLYLRHDSKTVYSHLHFSVYGKFQHRKVEQARAINQLLK